MIHRWRMRGPLQAYLDGEMPDATRGALTEHLRRCEACAAAARRLAETDQLLGGIRPTPHALMPAASRALLERALAEAGIHRGGPGRGFPLLAWGLAAALVAIASGAAAWWCRSDAPPERRLLAHSPGSQQPEPGVSPSDFTSRQNEVGKGTPDVPLRSNQVPAKRLAAPKKAAPPREDSPVQTPSPSISPNGLPRLRQPVRPRYRLCTLPTASWWRELETTVSASERAAGDLAAALDQGQAITCAEESQSPDSGSDPALLLPAVWPEDPLTLADQPPAALPHELPASVTDHWQSPDPGAPLVLAAAPSLLVMVSSEPAPSPLLVTEAPGTAPGFARCSAFRTEASGAQTWTQASATGDEEPKLEMVMLDSEFPWWE